MLSPGRPHVFESDCRCASQRNSEYAAENRARAVALFGREVEAARMKWCMFPPVSVVVTTSTPISFQSLLSVDLGIPLRGWAMPPLWSGYHGMNDWDVVSFRFSRLIS